MLQILTVPFNFAAKAASTAARVAAKAQEVATRVALSSAKVATRMTQRAAQFTQRAVRGQARATARAQARAIDRALKSLPKKPTTHFVKEVRHGRMSLSFYRQVDHRAGKVSEFWTLHRNTPRGRVRVASGSMSELHGLRSNRSARRAEQTQQPPERSPGAKQGQKSEARPAKPERSTKAEQDRGRPSQAVDLAKPSTYHLVYVEGRNADGTIRTRVVTTTKSLGVATTIRQGCPGLAIHTRTGKPLQMGDVINVDPRSNSDVAGRFRQREEAQKTVNSLALAALAAGTLSAATAPAQLPQQPKQQLSLER